MQIKVLGQGCSKCAQLYDEVNKAVRELAVEAEVVKVENMKDIVGYGVMRTPALVIDNEVKIAGKVPSFDEIKKLLTAGR